MEDSGFVFVAVIAFIIMAYGMIKTGKSDPQNKKPSDRRKEAIDNLERIRKKVQAKHGDAIREVLEQEAMKESINDSVESDALKASGSLKKMME
jgi:hypothetical protein